MLVARLESLEYSDLNLPWGRLPCSVAELPAAQTVSAAHNLEPEYESATHGILFPLLRVTVLPRDIVYRNSEWIN